MTVRASPGRTTATLDDVDAQAGLAEVIAHIAAAPVSRPPEPLHWALAQACVPGRVSA